MHTLLTKFNAHYEKTHPFALGIFEVNLKNLEYNILTIKQNIARKTQKEVQYLLPVKGGGYGCGMCQIAEFVQQKKLVEYLGVAHTQEAFELRKYGITLPILILGQTKYTPDFLHFISENSIDIAVSEEETVHSINRFFHANPHRKKISIHLKIDLGMGRCGILPHTLLSLLQTIYTSPSVHLCGVMMHFPVSDSDSTDSENFIYTEKQIIEFTEIQKSIHSFYKKNNDLNSYNSLIFHAANSGGAIEHISSVFDMIRPGIASYGYPEPGKGATELSLKPVVQVYSHFTLIKDFPKHSCIGYGRTYRTTHENEKIGIFPIGYADGLNRILSNNFSLYSSTGDEYTSVGRISMDQSTYRIPENYTTNDNKIFILGDKQSPQDIAKKCNTISYEVLLHLGTSHRLKKVYTYT